MTAKRRVLAALDVAQDVLLAPLRALGAEPFPIPPVSAMRRTTSRWLFHYYHSGLTTYLPIATAALREGVDLTTPLRVLDFGVGAARQLLHFRRHFPQPEYHACDVDPALVAFVARAYPGVQVAVNGPIPPLVWPDGHFDMIYGVSVFSHLSPGSQAAWLSELFRVTRPGGACLLTTEGWTALSRVARTTGIAEATLAGEMRSVGTAFRPYAAGSTPTGVGGDYGSTLLSPEHVAARWPGSGFRVVAILPGIVNRRQDLVVLRKP